MVQLLHRGGTIQAGALILRVRGGGEGRCRGRAGAERRVAQAVAELPHGGGRVRKGAQPGGRRGRGAYLDVSLCV